MIENFNDLMSLIVLVGIPVFVLIYIIFKKIGKRKEEILTTSEKYYREW